MNTIALQLVGRGDIGLVGGKAASLGEITKAGLPVPPGFVVTTAAYRGGLTPQLRKDIISAFDELGSKLVAVRSSAVAEDSDNASWAGQLESYLNIERSSVVEAVEDCWRSMNSKRAVAYADSHQVGADQRAVAVVVQAMVASDVAGVLFTANPVTQNRSEVVIEAVRGLGELLVQGAVTPESLNIDKASGKILERHSAAQTERLVYRDGATVPVAIPANEQANQLLSSGQVKQLLKAAVEIEKYYGVPQDIEWAIESDELFIVQSRPITTLEPFEAKSAIEPRFELLSPDYQVTPFVISRLAYIMAVRVGSYIANPPECILEFVDGNVNWYAEIPKWDVAAQEVVSRLLQEPGSFQDFNRMLSRDIDELKDLSRRLYLKPLGDLNNQELSNLHKDAMELYERVYGRGIIPTYTDLGTPYLSNELKAALAAYTSKVDRVFVLMTTPTELSELAQEELECLELAADPSVRRDSQAIADHQSRYYWLTYGYEGPPYSEDDIWGRMEEYRVKKASAAHRLEELKHHTQAVTAAIQNTVSELRLPHQLQMSLATAREWVSQKAARKEAFFVSYAAFDRIAAELAKRLERPKLQIKFLSYSEAQQAFKDGTLPVNLADRPERSVFMYREKTEQVLTGAAARHFLQNEIRHSKSNANASVIQGQVAYVGKVSGTVRIIREPADMSKMQPGDILVSAATNPNLLPAMRQAAAFVTDVGGITRHAAIVAREMKKPCIIGTKVATHLLKDGDFVEVDATLGTITRKSMA